jgi:signal transduction histidine kinase
VSRTGGAAVAVAGAVALAGVVAAAPYASGLDPPAPEAVFGQVLVGFAFLIAGIIAATRWPTNVCGRLMIAAGLGWYVPSLAWVEWGGLRPLALVETSLFVAILVHLVGVFPTGRMGPRPERLVVTVVYVYSVVYALVQVLAAPDVAGCSRCPGTPLFARTGSQLYSFIVAADVPVSAVLVAAAVACLVRRWRRASPSERRAGVPILWIGAAVGGLVVARAVATAIEVAPPIARTIVVLHAVAVALLPIGMLLSLLRNRLARWGVGDLVLQLAEPMPPGRLRDVLARVLADPSVRLAYRRAAADEWVDGDGEVVVLPQGDDTRSVTDLTPHVAIVHDPRVGEDPDLFESVVAAARLAMENERLQAEVGAQLAEVRRSRTRIVEAADLERRRVERDLHDGAQQRLISASLALTMLRREVEGRPDLEHLVSDAGGTVDAAIDELRTLARGIHPAILTDEGLVAAVESLVDRLPLPVDVHDGLTRRVAPSVETAAYFVVSEALTNVVKHARATGAEVWIGEAQGVLRVGIADDGVGGADPGAGTGLRGLVDRVGAVDGTLDVVSPREGGTIVRAEIRLR